MAPDGRTVPARPWRARRRRPWRLRRGARQRLGHGQARPSRHGSVGPGRRPDRPRRRAHRGDGLHPRRAPVRRPRSPGRDMVAPATQRTLAYEVAAGTPDPELPTLTIEDLGILRSVDVSPGGIVVTITPTYSGCPAMHVIGADAQARLRRAGFERVTVATRLAPPWSTDW